MDLVAAQPDSAAVCDDVCASRGERDRVADRLELAAVHLGFGFGSGSGFGLGSGFGFGFGLAAVHLDARAERARDEAAAQQHAGRRPHPHARLRELVA